MSVNLKWWDSKAAMATVAPPEKDRLEVLYEELVMTKSRFDELGRELGHFKAAHAIVEFGRWHGIKSRRGRRGLERALESHHAGGHRV